MPGTAVRACSSSTNVFHAASSGRGSAVTMTVSSMSERMPKRTAGSRMRTSASTGSASATLRRTQPQPGVKSASITVSTKPLRSAVTSWRTPSASMVTFTCLAGSVAKLRQPRTLSSRPRRRVSGRPSSTRQSTRAHPGAP